MAAKFPTSLGDDPASNAVAVTPSDVTDLDTAARGLYIGGAGNVTVVMHGGQTVQFASVPTGQILPIIVTRVKSSGTSATAIVALW